MKYLMHFLIPISVAVVLAACAPATQEPEPAAEEAPTTEADVEAIATSLEQELAAVNSGDAEAFQAAITNDAVLMPPNEPPVTGKEAILAWQQAFFDQATVQLSISFEEVEVAGNWAFARRSWARTLTPVAGGEPTQDNGQVVHIYQRQADGSWKVARIIWNSDNPPPGS